MIIFGRNLCIILFILGMYSASHVYAIERPELRFDERRWKTGYMSTQGNISITHFILEKERYEAWQEMVMMNIVHGMKDHLDVKTYIEKRKEKLIRSCKEFVWKEIGIKDGIMLYEWRGESCLDGYNKYNLMRVIEGKNAIHVVQYTLRNKARRGKEIAKRAATKRAKKDGIIGRRKDVWIRNLKEIRLVK